jgi:hypothetical protein
MWLFDPRSPWIATRLRVGLPVFSGIVYALTTPSFLPAQGTT